MQLQPFPLLSSRHVTTKVIEDNFEVKFLQT